MVARADAGLMTILGLQAGVAEDIQTFASEELKDRYLPRFASGEIMGAMDLTEANAGSDLGAIITRAKNEDGRYFIDGNKIFITNGGCEIHLVLARDDDTFEASKDTTRGLSLYIVPLTLPDGSENRVEVTRLEEKLGIHGSPTAAVSFDHAEGFSDRHEGRRLQGHALPDEQCAIGRGRPGNWNRGGGAFYRPHLRAPESSIRSADRGTSR